MKEKYYIFQLNDPATPGFCSFDKLYVGTENDLLTVADNLEKQEHYPETVSAIRSYFKGNHSAEHNIAYRKRKVLIPIKLISEHKMSLTEMKWTHINIWGFPYEMKCEDAMLHQIVFETNGKYYRCVRAWLKNLCYEGVHNDWNKLTGGFWGNDSILDVSTIPGQEDFTFNNLLYVVEEFYDDEETAVSDMQKKEKIELKRICDEIFADG